MSNISNVNLKTFSEQYAAPVNMQTRAVSDQAIGNKVDNKGLEKGDKVTIFGKEINNKKAIIGGLAISTAIAAAILIIKGKGAKAAQELGDDVANVANKAGNAAKEATEEAAEKASDDVARVVNKVSEAFKETAEETVEQMTEKIGDDAVAAVNKAGRDIEKTTTKVVEKVEETAKETAEEIRRSGNLEERIVNLKDESIDTQEFVKEALQADLGPEGLEAMSDDVLLGFLRLKENPGMSISEARMMLEASAKGSPEYKKASKACAVYYRHYCAVSDTAGKIKLLFTPEDFQAINKSETGRKMLIDWIDKANDGIIHEDEVKIINSLKQIVSGK